MMVFAMALMRISTNDHSKESVGFDVTSAYSIDCWYRSSMTGSREGGVLSKCRRLRAGDVHDDFIDIGQLKMCGCEPMITVNECSAPRL